MGLKLLKSNSDCDSSGVIITLKYIVIYVIDLCVFGDMLLSTDITP